MYFQIYFAVSTFTKGEQMVPVLNKLGTHCACYGNHDFGERHTSNSDFVSKEEPSIQGPKKRFAKHI